MKTAAVLSALVFVLSGCSAMGGSEVSAVVDKEAEAEQVVEARLAESGDKVYCRREHTLRGSRFNTKICRTASQITEEERAQQRMREGVRRMQDHASHDRTKGLGANMREQ